MTSKAFYGLILLLALVGLGLMWFSYPGEKQLALLYFKDHRYQEALTIYQRLYDQGDRDFNITLPLIEIRLTYGETRKAVLLMEDVVDQFPNDEQLRRRLGEIYTYDHRPYDYYRNLEILADQFHKEKDYRDLIEHYQDQGDAEKLIYAYSALIQLGIREEGVIYELAFLQAKTGAQADALKTLALLPEDSIESSDTILLYVTLLLEDEQQERAFQMALHFDERKKEIPFALRLAALFNNVDETEKAFLLLEPFKGELDQNLELFSAYISYGQAIGKNKEVRELLDEKFKQGKLPAELLSTYIDLLIEAGDAEALAKVIQRGNLNDLNDNTLIGLIEYLKGASDPKVLASIKKKLSEKRLKESPVLALVFSALEGNKNFLQERELTAPQRLELTKVFFRFDLPKLSLEAFDSFSSLEGLSRAEMSDYAFLAIDLEKVEQALALLEAVKKQEMAAQGEMILSIALGKNEKPLLFLEQTPPPELNLLEEIVRAALQVKNKEVSLKAALLWYQLAPGDASKVGLAEAYSLNRMDKEALELFADGPITDDLRLPYLLALRGAGDKNTFRKVFRESVLNNEIPLATKEEWAYAFLDREDKKPAKSIFRYLISKNPGEKNTVDNFLNLAGEHPTSRDLSQIISLASRAPPTTKALYLVYLNDVKEFDIVSKIVREQELSDPEIRLAYMEAILNQREYELFRCLSWEVFDVWNIENLRKLGILAFDYFVNDVSLQIFREITDRSPHGFKAKDADLTDLQYWAYSAYYLAAYSEAYPLLLEALDDNNSDIKTPYFIGEILWTWKCKCDAIEYYDVALWRIDYILETSTKIEEISEAIASLGSIQFKEKNEIGALATLAELVDINPDSFDAIADYADHLIAAQFWGSAGCLLEEFVSPCADEPLFHSEQGTGLFRVYVQKVKYLRLIGKTGEAFCMINELLALQDLAIEGSELWVAYAETQGLMGLFIEENAGYRMAMEDNPVNEIIYDDIWEAYQPYRSFLDATGELRLTSPGQTEHLYGTRLFKRFGLPYFLDFTFEYDKYSAIQVLQAQTGVNLNVRGVRQRSFLLGGIDFCNGDRFIGGFFFGQEIVGGKLEYQLRDVRGFSFLDLEYHYPTWEIIEAVQQRGLYDMIKIGRTHYFTRHFRIEGWTAYRFWGIAHIPEVANSWATVADVIWTFDDLLFERYLGEGGFLDVIYNLDAEYIFDRKRRLDATGTPYNIIPLLTQETHTLLLLANKVFNSSLRAEGFIGYSYNRHGKGAPDIGLKIVFGKENCWNITLDASREASTTTPGSVDRFLITSHVLF